MKNLLFILAFMQILYSTAQPKLVVGIVVDQMRYDYLQKYQRGFGEDGFNRLMKQGYNCHQTFFNYVPTYTGPGHASVYTGTTPRYHGIIANDWYNRETGGGMYCTSCKESKGVGTDEDEGKMCPSNLLVTTVTDELKMQYGNKCKVYGIALKDRGAILPAGHMADGAFWFEAATGNWISSDCYMEALPAWVTQFNKQQPWKKYLDENWNLLLPRDNYVSVLPDNNPYEGKLTDKGSPAFPYPLKEITKEQGPGLIRYTPFGNSLTTDLAIELIKGASLGKDSVPDFFCLSYSSPDYIGHHWGPHSLEVEDNYYRLDRDLARFFSFLDETVGAGNYTIFLTSDHGVAYNPLYLKDSGIPVKNYSRKPLSGRIDSVLQLLGGEGKWVQNVSNNQVFIDPRINEKVAMKDWQQAVKKVLMKEPYIQTVYTREELTNGCTEPVCAMIAAGYNPKMSGDLVYVEQPGWISYGRTGSTHGSPYLYDSRAPLIFYGAGIKKKDDYSPHSITDIAPTIAQLLNISWPNACTGRLVEGIFEE